MTNPCIPLDNVNRMTDIVFVETFGEVAENSPWVAEYALGIRPFLNRDAMITAFSDGLVQAREDAQLELIRAQTGSGSEKLSAENRNLLDERIAEYEKAFGFPFFPASSDVGADGIIQHFDKRMARSRDEEFRRVLAQIVEIFRIRIERRVCPDGYEVSAVSDIGVTPQDHRELDWEHAP